MFGFVAATAPGFRTERDDASTGYRRVNVLLLSGGAPQGAAVRKVRITVTRVPGVPDSRVEVNAGEFGQAEDLEVEEGVTTGLVKPRDVHFAPYSPAGFLEDIRPDFCLAAVAAV